MDEQTHINIMFAIRGKTTDEGLFLTWIPTSGPGIYQAVEASLFLGT